MFFTAVAPVIHSPPDDINVTRTESLIITCIIRGFPAPSIEWYFNGSLTNLNEQISIAEEYSDTSSTSVITVVNTTLTDSGEYSCTGTNNAGNVSSFPSALVLIQGEIVNPLIIVAIGLGIMY